MLLVFARKGPSQIHGLGLIAQELIPAGTRVWQFEPRFDVAVSLEDASKLSLPAQEQLRYYAYFDERMQRFVLSSDDDRFTNHACDPNTAFAEDGFSTVALTEIRPGDEITWDYRTFGNDTSFREK